MKTWDLTAGTVKLELAMKSLRGADRDVAEAWNDDTNRRVHETYIAPLEPRLKAFLDAIHRLAEVLANAEQQCGDHS